MYGLVNRAIEELVRSKYGDETWGKITAKAGLSNVHFVSLEAYPDETTLKLVGTASEVLGVNQNDLLEAFGEYWVLYTGKGAYGDLMQAVGKNVKEFLENLDNLHMRLGLTMPHLRPPSFECEDESQNVMRLHYRSTRVGLEPMVIGLIKGLGCMFNEKVEVVVDVPRSAHADHAEFLVTFLR